MSEMKGDNTHRSISSLHHLSGILQNLLMNHTRGATRSCGVRGLLFNECLNVQTPLNIHNMVEERSNYRTPQLDILSLLELQLDDSGSPDCSTSTNTLHVT